MIRASSKSRQSKVVPNRSQAVSHIKSGMIKQGWVLNHTVDNIPPDESMRGYVNVKIQKPYSNRQSVLDVDEPTRPVMPDDHYAISPQINGANRARAENMSKTDPKAFSYPGDPTDTTGYSEPRRLNNETEYYDEEEEAELNAQVKAFG